jgi:cyclophilin family peptidyl-prolyl cis-trans isomerase
MKKIFLLLSIFFYSIISFAQENNYKKKDYLITIKTNLGDIQLILFDATPLHKDNFIKLAKRGYYDGTTFHRVIPNFMIQGGDSLSKDDNPNNDGQGGPGYTIPAEFVDSLKHDRGMIAAARLGDGVNPQKSSSGSQFYIVQNKAGTHFLNGGYTVYGKVVKGLDVVDKIVAAKKDNRDRPLENITMRVSLKKISKKITD